MRGHALAMEANFSVRPTTCPWRAFDWPLVRDVLDLYGVREAMDPIVAYGAERIPNVVVEAYVYFDTCVRAMHAARDRAAREKTPKNVLRGG